MCSERVAPQKGPFCQYTRAGVLGPPALGDLCVLGAAWGRRRASAGADQMCRAGMSVAGDLVKTSG